LKLSNISITLPTQETLETLPDGDYLFVSDELIEGMVGNHKRIHLRKTGNEVVGINLLDLDGNPYFTGKVNHNSIVDVTLGRQIPLDDPSWQFSKGDSISLANYRKFAAGIDIKAIQQCVSVFASKVIS